MMRQAGRHMKAYRDLVAKYPTFRDRSETPEVFCDFFYKHYYVRVGRFGDFAAAVEVVRRGRRDPVL
jgi:hypothetical protein